MKKEQQIADEEHQRLLEEYENIRSRLAKIYNDHMGQNPINAESRISESNLPINAIVDELIFDRNSKTISRNHFGGMTEKLGSGAFGAVWKGILLKTRETVAIKTENRNVSHICNENKSQQKKCERCQSLIMLIREAKVMQHIKPHPNVLQMVAVCTEKIKSEGSIYLLTEFCAGGALKEYLRKFTPATPFQLGINSNLIAFEIQQNSRYLIPGSAKVSLNKQTLFSYCLQIASGMDYLSSIPILHRDLGLYTRNGILSQEFLNVWQYFFYCNLFI